MIRLALLAAPLVLAACAAAAPPGPPSAAAGQNRPAAAPRSAARAPAPAPPHGYPAIALVFPGPGVGGAEELRGRLVQSGQCLMLETPRDLVQLVFADIDVSWDWQASALDAGERSYRLGDGVELVGGAFAGDPEDLNWLRRPAPGCGAPFWIVSSVGPAWSVRAGRVGRD